MIAGQRAMYPHRIQFQHSLRKLATFLFLGICAVLAGSSPAFAQITLKNPKNLPVSEQKIEVLFRIACEEVAEQFHVVDRAKLDFPLTVILGEESHYTVDVDKQIYKIFLNRWDDVSFTSAAVVLAYNRLAGRDVHRKIIVDVLRRANNIAPVQAADLRKH